MDGGAQTGARRGRSSFQNSQLSHPAETEVLNPSKAAEFLHLSSDLLQCFPLQPCFTSQTSLLGSPKSKQNRHVVHHIARRKDSAGVAFRRLKFKRKKCKTSQKQILGLVPQYKVQITTSGSCAA